MVHFRHFAIFMAALLPVIFAKPAQIQQKRDTVTRKYIVTLKDGIDPDDVESHMSWVWGVYHRDLESTSGIEKTYSINTWNAYSGEFDNATIEMIKSSADVAEVEEDQVFTLSYKSDAVGLAPRGMITETNTTWGLGTVSHRTSGSDTYIYDSTAGSGTYAYIIDSGLMTSHTEFGGRATFGYNAFNGLDEDLVGHGTHVAGTIGGTTYGVAKSTALIGVKVFQDIEDTKTSIILEGYNWAVHDILDNDRASRSAISMSLGLRIILSGYLSYIIAAPSYSATQADVATFKALQSAPDATEYPHAARWYKHIATYEDEFASLPGDASMPYTTYGPEASEGIANPVKKPAAADDGDEEDLFGSDTDGEDPEAIKAREERLAAYREKKAAKPKTIAKTVVIMDVKPWDDETDMVGLESLVRGIDKDGLVWGASNLVAVGFGIKKLQINLVIEDEKISLTELQDEIQEFEDYVQSTDIATMQKL
ncbi:Translation elongation factor 1 beta [Neopestalotiopsis sp. 37M]|nr:Translation elongation factor 1 beta [Neopestalotiopsis sp. 37M]